MKKDGTLWTWGSNESGQLGDGTTKDGSTPKEVMSYLMLPGPSVLEAKSNSSKVFVDGKAIELVSYTINSNSYFKLRDIG